MGALDVLIGPMLIGTVLNVFLLGFMVMQCHIYYAAQHRDPTWMKCMVAFVLVADVTNTVFDIAFTYDYTITKFGKFDQIVTSTWVFNTDPVMTVILSSTVQSFFAWRVKRLTGQTWLGVIIGMSAFIQLLAGLGTTIACGIVKEFLQFQKFKSIVMVWLILASCTDVLITLSLVWFLRRHKTGFVVTDDLVTRIIRLTVQTGALTTIWAVTDLIVFLVYPNTLHLIFNMSLSKLYTNSLMSSLNARSGWNLGSSHEESVGGTRYKNKRDMPGIHVSTTETIHRDNNTNNIELEFTRDHHHSSIIGGNGHGHGTVKKPVSDGLSIHSGSIDDEYNKTEGLVPDNARIALERKVDVEWQNAV